MKKVPLVSTSCSYHTFHAYRSPGGYKVRGFSALRGQTMLECSYYLCHKAPALRTDFATSMPLR